MRFKDIPGNDKIKDTLRSMVDSDKMPHAIMLYGNPGIGKMMTARAFAQYAHCTNRKDGEPCGVCTSCRQHESLNHPDIHFSFPIVKSAASNILTSNDRIAQWQEMLRKFPSMIPEEWNNILDAGNSQPMIHKDEAEYILHADSLSSFSSKYKFFVIWLPEKMNLDASNRLLKVIEEPSPGTVFILVSNSENDVLPTISSRTRRFNMHPVEEVALAEYLSHKYSMNMSDASDTARLAEGSVARADQLASHTGERDEFRDIYQNIMRAAFAKKPAVLKQISDSISGMGREKLRRLLSYMSNMTRENFIYNLHNSKLVTLSRAEEEFSRRFSPFIHHANVEEIVEQIETASTHIARNGNSKVVTFSLFLYLIPLLHKKAE